MPSKKLLTARRRKQGPFLRVGSASEIPEPLRTTIMTALSHYAVELIALWNERTGPMARPCGSGTLVRVDDVPYVLTAEHVWTRGLKGIEHVGMSVGTDMRRVIMPKEALTPRLVTERTSNTFGPDLALLRLPPIIVAELGRTKSFYNLSLHRSEALRTALPPRVGLLVVVGSPEEAASLHDNVLEVNRRAFFAPHIFKNSRRGEFDYIDLRVNHQLEGIPTFFGGVSGGGVWRATPFRSKRGQFGWDGNFTFEGVAFYQTKARHGYSKIRCHGRRSIYQWLLGEIRRSDRPARMTPKILG